MTLQIWGWEAKVGDGIISWLIFLKKFLVLINDFFNCLLDFFTPLTIGFRLEG
jgi:hypothetical protein